MLKKFLSKYTGIIAHPSRQHSFESAIALYEMGVLKKYFTAIYNKNGTVVHWISRYLSKINSSKAESRRIDILQDNYISVLAEGSGLISLLFNRLPVGITIQRYIRRWASKRFNAFVFEEVVQIQPDFLIMYDTNAFWCFKKMHGTSIDTIKILDMSAIARPTAKRIINNEVVKVKDRKFELDSRYLNNDRYMKQVKDELQYADYFLVASTFTKNSLIECGISENKVFLLPYGIDSPEKNLHLYNSDQKKINLIYVGYVDYTKGVHYLIEAVNRLSNVELFIYGVVNKHSALYKQSDSSKIHYMGFVSKAELYNAYLNSDVFIFLSLYDGFGMVILEAMTMGLPVIASCNSAAPDIIHNREEGFIVSPSDVEQLINKIKYFYENQQEIARMGQNAYLKAKKYSKERYKKNLNDIIEIIMERKEDK